MKDYVYKRVEHFKGSWANYINTAIEVYNNKSIHRVINMTPAEARQPRNHLEVKFRLLQNAKQNRKYPPLDIEDKVRMKKKKI